MLGTALGRALCIAAGLVAVASAGAWTPEWDDELPLVDLDYAVHEAKYDDKHELYRFKNIRFAEPPVGRYRFKPSVPVQSVDRSVNDGSYGYHCMQGLPEWLLSKEAKKRKLIPQLVRKIFEGDRRQNEDCLFLDVHVPRSIFQTLAPGRGATGKKRAPVMVWIYGGGYVFGKKDDKQFKPTGLIERSMEGGGEGIIFVAMNYRLGMYGWQNVPGDDGIFPNVALQDQRLALEWVQKYIHLFGGDANRVTVFGESAGGGSIMHHITANDGTNKVPFCRAIAQSPGWQTVLDLNSTWLRTLNTASEIAERLVTNGSDLASLDAKTLFKINKKVIADSPVTTFTFGPSVDGGYVSDLPGVMLQQGKFDSAPDLMLGHNSNEGLIYVTPDISTGEGLHAKFDDVLPGIPPKNIDYVLDELYPPPPQPKYDNNTQRSVFLFSEAFFTCNTRYLATAFGNATWNYRFQVPPGEHAQDVPFTFFRGKKNKDSKKMIPSLAKQMQLYFTNFAMYGTPNGRQAPEWPIYGENADIVTFGGARGEGDAGRRHVGYDVDDTKNERCSYWQTGDYRS